MALKELLKLAGRIEKKLKTAVDVDALELYPGSEQLSGARISPKTKLQNAQRAAVEDLNSIASNYYMHESQLKQAQSEMQHALFLLSYVKQIQQLINDQLKTEEPNIDVMHDQVRQIMVAANDALPANQGRQPHARKAQALAELTSLRLLRALMEDEITKNLPPSQAPDYAAMSRQNKEDLEWESRQQLKQIHPDTSDEETVVPVKNPSTTMKSRQEGELDDTQPAPK